MLIHRIMEEGFRLECGFPYPFGVSHHSQGYNFALFSKNAYAVSLVLFDPENQKLKTEISLNPKTNKTGNIWHIFVKNLPGNFYYGYRIDGPYDPITGHYFDNQFILLDPYAKEVTRSSALIDNVYLGSVDPFLDPFAWEEDHHPNIPMKDLIIYEMHVRGFTQDSSSCVKNKGTFEGIIEKIPYLQDLGINAIELMPIHYFNENTDLPPRSIGRHFYNYWGYSTVNFFAPMERYGSINEFKHLVKELHTHGIEVILDVVYNHTGEGVGETPNLSFRGIDNSIYYMVDSYGKYYNFSGCGNTLNCNHSIVSEMIKDSLRYWVTEMHVDGFRFDLASVFTRDSHGNVLKNPPIIEMISQDPMLATTKLIAEAWDAGGLYQVGSFPGTRRWAEWNGKYRDSIRRFIKGNEGMAGEFATRLSGSEDLYGNARLPSQSINFVTAHDGFTLIDLVSYNEKHNWKNGELNQDGSNHNESWNCGTEGPTEDEKILKLRLRQRKNFHLALMVSQGVPMVLMGDEYGHTKEGNNNSWQEDSRINWFQWDNLNHNQSFFRFYQKTIAFRKNHPILTRSQFLKDSDIQWHGTKVGKPDWSRNSKFIAFVLSDPFKNYALYIAFNAYHQEMTIDLPKTQKPWHCLIYTANDSPKDIVEENQAPVHSKNTIILDPHSSVVLKTYLI